MKLLLPYFMRQGAALWVSALLGVSVVMAQPIEPVVSVVFAGDIMLEGGT